MPSAWEEDISDSIQLSPVEAEEQFIFSVNNKCKAFIELEYIYKVVLCTPYEQRKEQKNESMIK